jgi:hypothetical protein
LGGDYVIHGYGERKKGALRPDFNRSIKMDFQGATLCTDTGFLLLREIASWQGIASLSTLLRAYFLGKKRCEKA